MNHVITLLVVANLVAMTVAATFTGPGRSEGATARPQTTMPEFVLRLMEQCGASMSDARRSILSQQLARIAQSSFATREQMESFVLLVCIESKFQSGAKSKAGAVGLTQVMPKYSAEFATQCGLGKPAADDLMDSEINLTIGACQFRKLLDSFEGNIGLALAAYNAGQFSDTAKKAALLQSINPETANYLAKFLVLQQHTSAKE